MSIRGRGAAGRTRVVMAAALRVRRRQEETGAVRGRDVAIEVGAEVKAPRGGERRNVAAVRGDIPGAGPGRTGEAAETVEEARRAVAGKGSQITVRTR